VAQEAFLQAHRDLPMLREPAAFPHWLRRIVAKYVDRVVRGRKLPTVPLDEALSAKDEHWEPSGVAEAHERSDLVSSESRDCPSANGSSSRSSTRPTARWLTSRPSSECQLPPSRSASSTRGGA
jgi:hypothetical protein